MRSFASDNNSGIHPNIINAIAEANQEHAVGYGDDPYTEALKEKFSSLFGKEIEMALVFNGTGANIIGIQSATQSFNAVICAETAHINVDECGAPEKMTGCKIISIPTEDGKLTPELIKPQLHGFGFEHHSQPKVISITQTSEMGTVYTPAEIQALADLAHEHDMYLHMDGARIANAIAFQMDNNMISPDSPPLRELVGAVDFMSFGGTKNGMMLGESVIFLNTELAKNTKYFRKQNAQLYSKMRYHSAQFLAYLENDLWLENARHANMMAQLLLNEVSQLPNIEITQKVESNGIFAIVPHHIIEPLMQKYFFYMWDENRNEVRWMCSFDTTEEDIAGFVATIKEML